ncbi:MAG: DUF4911 domain-containing protein [Bacteriovoracaceae bacterium]|nr:DUF4911 domain-containing protein [Bacteriovoracaceae bacterium]
MLQKKDISPTEKLYCFVLKVPKEESFFVYFILEAYDGICFYSTLPHQEGETHRLLDLKTTELCLDDLLQLLNYFKRKFLCEITKEYSL